MRNRFHKEPVNKEDVIRPDEAGAKENPDYVVNIQGWLFQIYCYAYYIVMHIRVTRIFIRLIKIF